MEYLENKMVDDNPFERAVNFEESSPEEPSEQSPLKCLQSE